MKNLPGLFSAAPGSGAWIPADPLQLLPAQGSSGAPATPMAAFANVLDEARLRGEQSQAAIESFSRVDQPGRIHETVVAATKAEISLRTLVTVRNKLLEAYRDLLHVTT